MHSDLRIIDPLFTTAYITRDHGYMVYDTLLATDSNFKVQPQMADWKVSDDKLTYTFTLRDGLKWHDGAPVTAEDCVASLKRWGRIDNMGQKLMDFTASIEATDAKTIVLKLKEPYGLVLESIGKPSSYVPFMMPKRLAETPAGQQIAEQIGSGPFKFVKAEFQPGVKAVYEKNTDYVPRKEPPSWTSGGKVVKVDRVEWITMPDAQTAVNALQSGDIDFMEDPPFDLLPVLEANPGHQDRDAEQVRLPDARPHEFPAAALRQRRRCAARRCWRSTRRTCSTRWSAIPNITRPAARSSSAARRSRPMPARAMLAKGGSMAEAKKALAESGYDGTPVVIMAPGDVVTLKAQPIVAAQLLRQAGFKVDVQATDWQTVVSRRASQKPASEGGWNMFFTNWVAADVMNPLVNFSIGGRGKNGGWFGWAEDAKIEKLKDQFARSSSPEEQKKIATEIQQEAYDQVIYIPLGQYHDPERVAEVAHRRARRPGDADLLEHRQERVGRASKPSEIVLARLKAGQTSSPGWNGSLNSAD